MKENVSPEERLLRLIRQGAKKSSSSPSTIPPKPKKPIFSSRFFSKFLKVGFLNNLLLILLLLSLLALVLDFIILPKYPSEIKLTSVRTKDQDTQSEDLLPKMKPYSYYAQQIGKRNLFVSSVEKAKEAKFGPRSLTLQEMMRDFTLIGIMEGQNPQAIIEDKKAKKTYFLNRGDYLGVIKIADIQEGKVTLEYQGESFDLFL